MAHLRLLGYVCQRCGKPAKVELFNRVNASHGKFCDRCGERARSELQQAENREAKPPA